MEPLICNHPPVPQPEPQETFLSCTSRSLRQNHSRRVPQGPSVLPGRGPLSSSYPPSLHRSLRTVLPWGASPTRPSARLIHPPGAPCDVCRPAAPAALIPGSVRALCSCLVVLPHRLVHTGLQSLPEQRTLIDPGAMAGPARVTRLPPRREPRWAQTLLPRAMREPKLTISP